MSAVDGVFAVDSVFAADGVFAVYCVFAVDGVFTVYGVLLRMESLLVFIYKYYCHC